MANVVVLCKDDRVRQQLETFLKELGDDIKVTFFTSNKAFQDLYFPQQSNEENPAAPPPSDGGDESAAQNRPFVSVHLVIYALDTIEGKPGPWLEATRGKLKSFKYFADAGPPRFIMLKYEDDSISKLDILHEHLDDLIYLPLDRMIFLQKTQIIAALPKKATPTFLFNQEVNAPIEISKIVKLDRLSDVGLAIRNPVALRKGLSAHFYFTPPGEKKRLEIMGKVIKSEPHPDHADQFLVYFSYFGISRDTVSDVRRTLARSTQNYKSLLNDDRDRMRFNPDDVFFDSSTQHVFGIVVIDTNEDDAHALADNVGKEMDQLSIATVSSYQYFLHGYMSDGGTNDAPPPRATEETELFNKLITITASAKELNCLSVTPSPTETDVFLGHSAVELFSAPEKWRSLIQDKSAPLMMEESVQLALQERTVTNLVAMTDLNGQRLGINLRFTKGPEPETVTIEITAATLQDIADKVIADQKPKNIEGIIVNTDFVPSDPIAWVEGLRNRAAQVGLVKDPQDLKFWLTSDKDVVLNPWLKCPDILGLYQKPVDQRQLLFSLSNNLPNKHTVFTFDNIGWGQPNLPVHVSKELDLEAISEYGATLRSKQKLVPGSIIYLRKSIYDNAPNGCLAARVYACEEHPKEKTDFQIFVTYFGINDAFLKFARTWIRENYAHAKSQSQSGGQ